MCERNEIFENNHGIAMTSRVPHLDSLSPVEGQPDGDGHAFEFTPVIDLNSYMLALKTFGVDEKSRIERAEICRKLLASPNMDTRKMVALGVLNVIKLSKELGK